MNDKCRKMYKEIWEIIKDKREDEVREIDNFMYANGYTNLNAIVSRGDVTVLQHILKLSRNLKIIKI